ncbi:MAG: TIM barrel protein [Chloroflexota bacterium]
MIKKSIATVSLSGTLREKLTAVAAAGFTGVEIFENDLLSFDGAAQDIRRLVEDLGLEIVVFQPFRDFEGMPDSKRIRNFERAERKFDLMEQLGVDLLLVCSNVSPTSLGGINRAADDLHQLGERAARRGLRIGFEALAWGRHISDYRDAWEVVRRANHPAVGTIIDSFHVFARGHELTTLSSIPGDRIFLIHIADAPLVQMDHLSWSRHFRCFPGQGEFPLDQFMTAVMTTDYNDWFSLEIFNDYFRAAPTQQTALDGYRSLIFLGEQATLKQQPSVQPDETPPTQASFAGLEFIEFAVDEETALDLEKLFQAFGFRLAGHHRSKEVSLWQQGDIHLLINTDKEGFAHEYQLVHGPSVCAMGMRVDDAQQAFKRAKAYRCLSYQGVVGPGELEIPAIRLNSDDYLLYLVDTFGERGTIWEVDFTLYPPTAGEVVESLNPSLGLQQVDHLAQVTAPGQLPSQVLFYHAILGFDVAPQREIVDPHGLIQSQVVASQDQRIRLALNTSQSQRTLAGRFLSEFLGSGIQHVAFYSDNIFETVKYLQKNGVTLLPIPANYYDDLDARYGLDPTLLETLRQYQILYARNETGELFHVYTATFAGRLFFEIVERRNYDGFGAVNASIRLASQARTEAHL